MATENAKVAELPESEWPAPKGTKVWCLSISTFSLRYYNVVEGVVESYHPAPSRVSIMPKGHQFYKVTTADGTVLATANNVRPHTQAGRSELLRKLADLCYQAALEHDKEAIFYRRRANECAREAKRK